MLLKTILKMKTWSVWSID